VAKLTSLRSTLQMLNTNRATPLASGIAFADQARGTAEQRGYGSEWKRLRKLVIKRDKYQCQECRRQGRVTPGQDVDHIVNKAQGGTDALDNLQYLCGPCHKEKTAQESNASRT